MAEARASRTSALVIGPVKLRNSAGMIWPLLLKANYVLVGRLCRDFLLRNKRRPYSSSTNSPVNSGM